jgi:predicted small lipoprotein YifL
MQTKAHGASALALLGLALAGCGGGLGGLEFPGSSNAPPPAAAPAVNIGGRWLFASPGRGQCYMTFGSDAGSGVEGTIRPEGGCPGKFFTSRKWTYEQGNLVMRDHKGQPLAQLSAAGPNFDGKSVAGEPVTLAH